VSKASDVWSFGIVLWEILEMKQPYNDIFSNREVVTKVCEESLRLPKPTRITYPSVLDEVMQSCWNSEASLRPSFIDIHKNIAKGTSYIPDLLKRKRNRDSSITKENNRKGYVQAANMTDSYTIPEAI